MITLSIQQPWAWAIVTGAKDIENRDWYTGVRGRVLVHCGKRFDFDSVDYLEEMGLHVPSGLQLGGIIGSVEIIDCVKQSKSKWFFGEYGFVLRNPEILPFVPYRGQLGFFEVNYEEIKIAPKQNITSGSISTGGLSQSPVPVEQQNFLDSLTSLPAEKPVVTPAS